MKMISKRTERIVLALIILVTLAVGILAGVIYKDITEDDRSREFRTLDVLIEEIQKNYYDEVERSALIDAAIKGMFTELDAYSMAYTFEEYAAIAAANAGQNKNFGYSVRSLPRRPLSVSKVIGNSPAYHAGLKSGDEIVGIRRENGEYTDTSYMSSSEVLDLLRTSKYKLTVQRLKPDKFALANGKSGSEFWEIVDTPDNYERVELPQAGYLESKEYNVEYVYYYIDGGEGGTNITDTVLTEGLYSEFAGSDTAYIKITEFSGTAGSEFAAAMKKFGEAGKKKLVLDLRDNPGGNTDVLGVIAGYLIHSKNSSSLTTPVFVAKYRDGTQKTYTTKTSPLTGKANNYTDFFEEGEKNIVVLVNGMSASASEALACAIRDYGTGTLVGTTTYKKGIMQSTYNLNYRGIDYYLKVTVATFFSPVTDVTLHDVGLTPAGQNFVEDNFYGVENCRMLIYDNQFLQAIENFK